MGAHPATPSDTDGAAFAGCARLPKEKKRFMGGFDRDSADSPNIVPLSQVFSSQTIATFETKPTIYHGYPVFQLSRP